MSQANMRELAAEELAFELKLAMARAPGLRGAVEAGAGVRRDELMGALALTLATRLRQAGVKVFRPGGGAPRHGTPAQ